MPAEAKSCLPRNQNSDRARGVMRARGQSVSPDRVQGSRIIAVRDARPAPLPHVKGPSAERPLTSEFPRRSRTVSPSKRSNYRPRDTSNTNKGPSGKNKDTTNNKQNQKRNEIGSDQHNKKKTNENKCLSLIDEVSNKILEANDQLNAADVKVLGDRLSEKLMKGVNKTANEAEPSKLYREDSTYRIIKSSHQHQKVMQHCGIKKQKNKISETNVKTNLNSKSRYDRDYAEFSGNTDDWTGVPRDAEKKCGDVSADITPKVSKKSSVNKKKSCNKKLSTPKLSKENKELLEFAKSQDFNREDKIDTFEDILSVEDCNTWKKLPEAVDKLLSYIDGMANKEAEPGNEIVKNDKPQKTGKKGNIVKDRREKMKLEGRLTMGLKLETRAQERKCDQKAEQTSADGNSEIDSSNDDICFGVYHDSKVNMFNPNNTGALYEGIFSGGDIRPNKQSRVSTKDTPLRAQRCQKPRSPTTTQLTSFVSHYD